MKLISFTFYFIICVLFNNAQNGLEKIIVEKYYVSNLNDSLISIPGGPLPVGSVTYRIYVDMLPGYRFQAAFGIPGHELRLETSTTFFNNEDKGRNIANIIPLRNLKNNTVMLDSWLSVGAASEGNFGVLKDEDDTINTVVHEKSFLQSENKEAGTPIKMKDGLREGNPSRPTIFGIDSILTVFDNKTIGSLFSTTNGSWASLYGAIGPDSLVNKVLIAQITTNGTFSFELNIQLGTPYRGTERYVAKNPQENEIQLPSLTYKNKQLKFLSPRVTFTKKKIKNKN